MGIISIIRGCFVFFWLCLPSPSECQVSQPTVSSFPVQPVENGNVTLTCSAAGFDPNAHMFTWLRSYNSSYVNVIPDHRMSFSPDNLIDEVVKLYSQSLTITNLTKSDEGLFLCVIVANNTAGTILTNGQGRLTVNSTEEFPVCFPDGPAVVNEGDILTCSTVIDERTPVVSDTKEPVERPDWKINSTQAGNESRSRLQKSVQVSDDGVTFFCFSITPENQNWTSLSCKIGPLTVTRSPTTKQPLIQPTGQPALPLAVIIGIAVGAGLLLVIILIIIICCCCREESYLLNFDGFFGSTIRKRTSRHPNQAEVELDRQNPDGSDEPSPMAQDGQVRFSFDDGADHDVLPIVKIEPNIYEERRNPGTSSQRETDPEEDAYWNENLKQQLADAVDEDDDFSD
ncbi:uncharacterized protein [Asterias amurensis]|uniref:uncharacterized protein n=1 Tax=Asterias amurensis TaxID=7602 RepID=UPI003AB4F823